MKKTLMAISVSLLFAASAFAIDAPPQPKGTGQHFEQNKADILKRIDQRIARNQEERACVQAAKNHDDIKSCREKFKAEVQEQRQNMKR
jgi:hypothetical protein